MDQIKTIPEKYINALSGWNWYETEDCVELFISFEDKTSLDIYASYENFKEDIIQRALNYDVLANVMLWYEREKDGYYIPNDIYGYELARKEALMNLAANLSIC